MTTQENVVLTEVAEAIAKKEKSAGDGLITLKSGVVVRPLPFAVGILMNLQEQFDKRKPSPPRVFMEHLGREEINDEDPDYIKAYEQWTLDYTLATQKLAMASGIEVVSYPETFPDPTDTSWLIPLQFAGLDVTLAMQNESVRKIYWLQQYAAAKADDLVALVNAVMRVSGVSQEEVAQEVDNFRSP